ncbi:hypothetical protein AU255_02400 [Methyloprofundus sedimenti]|uniref:Uncharacterized protein n=1 Tax=Methyloprofundus sedimenti TaxID=1420851 RepID=A0A1V8M5D6_9GAMM|nr:hypothetical protein AU255_02400 [Methyloprofundus sedimenti]
MMARFFVCVRTSLHIYELYDGKTCQRPDAKVVEQEQQLTVLAPVKKQKRQKYLEPLDQRLSTAVSRVR